MTRIGSVDGGLACEALGAATVSATVPTSANAAASSCIVAYSVAGSWNTGCQGGVAVTNNRTAISNRTPPFVFPGNQQTTGDRDGTRSQSGPTAHSLSWNGPLATGATVPVIAGEIGENDYADTYVSPLMTWLDSEKAHLLSLG